MAALLVLALTVIEPPRLAAAVRLALAFDAVAEPPIEDLEVALDTEPLAEAARIERAAADVPLTAVAWEGLDEQPQPSLDAIELDAGEQHADLPLDDVLAAVPDVVGLTGLAAAPVCRGGTRFGPGGGDGGFGGELGRRLKAAGARTGDVQVSIAWDNFNDIDVHVMVESVAPRRGISMINYSNPRGACGGWLDVDQNVVPMTRAAVENVFWARGTAPFGRYTVYVHHFRNWGGTDPTRVHVAVLVDGKQSHHTAVVHAGSGPVVVTSFVRRPDGTSTVETRGLDEGSLAPAP